MHAAPALNQQCGSHTCGTAVRHAAVIFDGRGVSRLGGQHLHLHCVLPTCSPAQACAYTLQEPAVCLFCQSPAQGMRCSAPVALLHAEAACGSLCCCWWQAVGLLSGNLCARLCSSTSCMPPLHACKLVHCTTCECCSGTAAAYSQHGCRGCD